MLDHRLCGCATLCLTMCVFPGEQSDDATEWRNTSLSARRTHTLLGYNVASAQPSSAAKHESNILRSPHVAQAWPRPQMEITHHCNSVPTSVCSLSVCQVCPSSSVCVCPRFCLYLCQYLSGSLVMNLPACLHVCLSLVCLSVCLQTSHAGYTHSTSGSPLHFYPSLAPCLCVCPPLQS